MLNTAGLSLQQAPPISIPLRFFLTAPLFGLAAGVLLLAYGDVSLVSRWLPSTLAATHLLTVGFLAMVMCGAMLQMLPVMAGSPVPRVKLVGSVVHALLSLGTALLAGGFLTGSSAILLGAIGCLGLGFAVFVVATGVALYRVAQAHAATAGMKLAVAALVMTVALGSMAAASYTGIGGTGTLRFLADVHLVWGLMGWVGLLLMSVSFQLIPMFQVTAEYPRWLTWWLPRGVFLAMILWLVYGLSVPNTPERLASTLIIGVIAVLLVTFSLFTLMLLRRRKRRIVDSTLMFWWVGMVSMPLLALFWATGYFVPFLADSPEFSMVLGVGLIFGIGYPLVNGMLYKIVPFLSWFHLQNRQLALMCLTVNIPHMKEFVSDRASRGQFYSYLVTLLLALLAVWNPGWLVRPAALMLISTNLLLIINLVRAVYRFRSAYRQLSEMSAASVGIR